MGGYWRQLKEPEIAPVFAGRSQKAAKQCRETDSYELSAEQLTCSKQALSRGRGLGEGKSGKDKGLIS